MTFTFTKMHALGNNYIYVNRFTEKLDEELLPDLAKKVSNVRTGIGSDGMILICPSEDADIKMRVFNADGSEARNCGNGLRCVAKYAFEKGIVQQKHFFIETLGGIVEAHVSTSPQGSVQSISIDMGKPILHRRAIPIISDEEDGLATNESVVIDGENIPFVGVSMGNPHAVIFVHDVHKAPVDTLGPKIEKHAIFPEWTNVEFIHVINQKEIDFRVWERGSGITHACGTGACAAVVAATIKGLIPKAESVTVHLLGGDLHIAWQEDDHVWMTGPAEYVCHGEYLLT